MPRARKKAGIIPPKMLNGLLCDAISGGGSGEKTNLMGIFLRINASAFPCLHRRMGVFTQWINGLGKQTVTVDLQYKELKGKYPRASLIKKPWTYSINFSDRSMLAEMCMELNGLPLPVQGDYWLIFRFNGKKCGELKFVARKVTGS